MTPLTPAPQTPTRIRIGTAPASFGTEEASPARSRWRQPLSPFAATAICLMVFVESGSTQALGRYVSRSTERTKNEPPVLRAFGSALREVKDSVVRLDVDGKKAALATIIDSDGLAITKASEVAAGKLTCQLPDGRQVDAMVLAVDEDNDLGLIRVQASGLKPVQWVDEPASVGQWAITPGVENTAEAVGIVSTPARQILPKQAFLGVTPDFEASAARLRDVLPGMGADKAGLKAGDVILTVDEHPVKDGKDLVKKLRTYREGQSVMLHMSRGSQEWDAKVELKGLSADGRWHHFNRQERMNRLGGELSRRAEGFQLAIQHDSVLQPWQCGGPLLNLEGRPIGLNIARAGRVATYALPAALVQHLTDDLKKRIKVPVKHDGTY